MAFSHNRSRDYLDTPLLQLSREGDVYSIRDSFQHLHCFGATGAGKTSAMKALSAAMLRTGYSFVVFLTKVEEIDFWISHARANGRGNDVICFDETQGCNFIDHALAQQGVAGLSNVVELILRIVEAADQASGTSVGRQSDEFWKQAIREFLVHAVPVLYSGNGRVSIASIIDFITSAATEPDGKQYTDRAFQATSFASQTLERAATQPAVPLPPDDLKAYFRYWFHQYTAIPEKTRGNVVISLTTKLGRFKYGRMKSCWCDKTTIVPEVLYLGGIILMCMPVLTWNEDGIIGQILWKAICQRTIEARNALAPHLRERPIVLWMDEAQNFIQRDEAFLSTARSSRAAVVAMSQSLPTYFSRVGPEQRAVAEAFIGKFNTQVFMNNSCPQTNHYASSLIGRAIQHRTTHGTNGGRNWSRQMNEGGNVGWNDGHSSQHGSQFSGSGGGSNYSAGSTSGTNSGENWGANVGDGRNEGWNTSQAEQMDNILEPNTFATSLRTGGELNGNLVDAIWFRAGANFRGGTVPHFLKVTFRQGQP